MPFTTIRILNITKALRSRAGVARSPFLTATSRLRPRQPWRHRTNKGGNNMANTVLRSRWVMARGVKTHYAESGGDGKVLVALHGGGAGSSGVAGMGLVMEKLADDFRCIAPDSIGGFGLTDPYAKAPHGLNSRAEHTADVIDALCLDKITILGNSQGAFTAA